MSKTLDFISDHVADSQEGVEDLAKRGRLVETSQITLEKTITETLSNQIVEYHTDAPASLCPVCNGTLKTREHKIEPPDDFEETKHQFLIESTHQERSCRKCNSEGQQKCKSCGGTGEEDCSYCDGTGYDGERSSCRACELNRQSKGKVACSVCGGRGSIMCNQCRGESELHIFKKEEILFKVDSSTSYSSTTNGIHICRKDIQWDEVKSEIVAAEETDSIDVFPDDAQLRKYRDEGTRTVDKTSLDLSSRQVRNWNPPASDELLRVWFSIHRSDAEEVQFEYDETSYRALITEEKSGQKICLLDDYPEKSIGTRILDTVGSFLG